MRKTTLGGLRMRGLRMGMGGLHVGKRGKRDGKRVKLREVVRKGMRVRIRREKLA